MNGVPSHSAARVKWTDPATSEPESEDEMSSLTPGEHQWMVAEMVSGLGGANVTVTAAETGRATSIRWHLAES